MLYETLPVPIKKGGWRRRRVGRRGRAPKPARLAIASSGQRLFHRPDHIEHDRPIFVIQAARQRLLHCHLHISRDRAQVAKNTDGLAFAVSTIVWRPCSCHTSARSRRNAPENCCLDPTGRPLTLPDWPGCHLPLFVFATSIFCPVIAC
jgi:hypothetical protein